MSFKPVHALGAVSTRAREITGATAELSRASGSRRGSAKLRAAATLALALAASAMTIGAAVVVAPDPPNPDVTGTITKPSGQKDADPYIDLFASGPGRGWFELQPALSAPDGSGNRKTDP